MGKATEAARRAYERLSMQQSTINKPLMMTYSTPIDVTFEGAQYNMIVGKQ